jgi:cytochrome c oxidase cbb3-type subunit 3
MNQKHRKTGKPIKTFSLLSCFAYLLLFLSFLFSSCKKEQRAFNADPMKGAGNQPVQVSDLAPGPDHTKVPDVVDKYENNAWNMAEGKKLFQMYNCVGCHANGGGGMGPALIDSKWLYGYEPQQIYATIIQGRPNGMPSFRGKIPEDQVWKLVAYVRSLGGLTNTGVEAGRGDDLKGKPPENTMPQQTPANTSEPKP